MIAVLNWIDRRLVAIALVPVGALLLAIVVLPFVTTVSMSLFDYSPILPEKPGNFVGLRNYVQLLQDSVFGGSILRTVRFVGWAVTLEMVVGTALAIWLSSLASRTRWLLPFLLIPILIPPVTVALLGRLVAQSEFGIVTYLLRRAFGEPGFTILANAPSAFAYLVALEVWQWTPAVALVVLVGLRSVPTAAREAAVIDGATRLQVFRDITMRHLWPFIVVTLVLRGLDSLRVFESVYLSTGGGPGNATELLNVYLWRVNFRYWDNGYGAALVASVYVATCLVLGMAFGTLKRVLRWDT